MIVPMLAIFCGPVAAAQTEPADIKGLGDLVGQLTQLRLQIAREQREWGELQPRLRRELELLKKQQSQLQSELEGYRAEQSTVAEERSALLGRREQHKRDSKRLNAVLRSAEAELQAMQQRIPKVLLGDMRKTLEQLPSSSAEAEQMSVARRLQLVLSVYAGIQKLQHELHLANALIPFAQRREMETLYIGLTQAFAVAPDGKTAAVGRLDAQGEWIWRRRDELAPAIARAVAVYRREEPAALIDLPLRAGKGGAQ